MTHWRADLSAAEPMAGATLTFLSHHHVVRLIAEDSVSIANALGDIRSAVVRALFGGELGIVIDDGESFALTMELDESLLPPGTMRPVFSRQIWVLH
ncbi:MAG: hypothetical protein EOP22_14350 [Hyphomicrobiales bacterium]|nr:MAG: hypothetical protein EOP22_14350 [Hyphomicrobiales bacterium]